MCVLNCAPKMFLRCQMYIVQGLGTVFKILKQISSYNQHWLNAVGFIYIRLCMCDVCVRQNAVMQRDLARPVVDDTDGMIHCQR